MTTVARLAWCVYIIIDLACGRSLWYFVCLGMVAAVNVFRVFRILSFLTYCAIELWSRLLVVGKTEPAKLFDRFCSFWAAILSARTNHWLHCVPIRSHWGWNVSSDVSDKKAGLTTESTIMINFNYEWVTANMIKFWVNTSPINIHVSVMNTRPRSSPRVTIKFESCWINLFVVEGVK